MNFGPAAKDAFRKQQPTYQVAPNFTTRPFPKGPLELGTLVEDLTQYYPINQGVSNRVAIPEGQRYSDVKEDVKASLKNSISGEASILARILDHSIGGDASLKGQKKDEDVYNIERLETMSFYPKPSYIKECLQLSDVKDYNEMADYKVPVYLITGLKIAWGATISTERGRDFDGKAEGGAHAVVGPVDLQINAQAGISRESEMLSSFGKPADFVLGIQVQKIYHKRAFLVGQRALTVERVTKHAVLVDDDDEPRPGELPHEPDFVTVDLSEGEVGALFPWTGHDSKGDDEIWLLPRCYLKAQTN